LKQSLPQCRWVYFTAHSHRLYYEFRYRPGDCLVFGSETRGLPRELLESEKERSLCVPIDRCRVRSLNMAATVTVVLYEAIRQLTIYRNESFDWFPSPPTLENCKEAC
jgi:tRNA (cytidine/uridine-2'-O-)-methyltransferase